MTSNEYFYRFNGDWFSSHHFSIWSGNDFKPFFPGLNKVNYGFKLVGSCGAPILAFINEKNTIIWFATHRWITQGPRVTTSCARATRYFSSEYEYLFQNLSKSPLRPQRPPYLKDLHILTASVQRGELDLIHYSQLQWRNSCVLSLFTFLNVAPSLYLVFLTKSQWPVLDFLHHPSCYLCLYLCSLECAVRIVQCEV